MCPQRCPIWERGPKGCSKSKGALVLFRGSWKPHSSGQANEVKGVSGLTLCWNILFQLQSFLCGFVRSRAVRAQPGLTCTDLDAVFSLLVGLTRLRL